MLFSLHPSQFLGLPFLPNGFDPLCIVLQNHLPVKWDLFFLYNFICVILHRPSQNIDYSFFPCTERNRLALSVVFIFFMLVIEIGYKN